MAGKGPVVPKFGSWDAENIGYTVFFEKVRENKTTPVPPTTEPRRHDDQEFDPYEYYENLSRNVPSRPPSSHGHAAPAQHYEHVGGNVPSRPPSSYGGHGHGHPAPAQHHYPAQHGGGGYHRRNGSNGSSAASEVSSRASKYSPPGPYQPRYTNNSGGGSYHQPQHQQQQYQGAAPGPRQYHPHTAPAPRVAASPPVNERRPGQGVPQARAAKAPSSAVPKFGVWDEQNANAAGQGYTVQFEKVKRHREVAKAAAPDVAPPKRQLSPDRAAPTWGYPRRKPKKSFLSKVYGCLFPVVRQ